ncbi:MAG: caspase family protein [Myxococcaceae bacterium]|nr:caspase family protein [Myxococcaceae bacterium]
MMLVGLLAAVTVLGASDAPTRLAIVAGHNRGAEGQKPLRYAEADAAQVKRALVEVASVAERDVKLVKAPTLAQLDAAFAWAKGRAAEVHAAPGKKVVLYVYVSAHGHEGRGLELGPEVLEWERLKAHIRATGADAKVTIIDSCRSSGLLKAGGRAADDFALQAEDRLTVEGEAWITSSAEDEPSVEAGAWRGSVFTHHLIAGLRGAADRSADRRVSLEELYRYAFERTSAGESGQHPGYAFELKGYGELDVSDLSKAAAQVTLPASIDAVTITDQGTGDSLAEARRPVGRVLGFGVGRVDVRLLRGADGFATRLMLAAGDRVTLDEAKLERVAPNTALLVRLRATCWEVTVPRPSPRLDALKERLQGRCEQPVRATLTHENGLLKLTAGERVLEAADDDALVGAALR